MTLVPVEFRKPDDAASNQNADVIAPSVADDTSRAYFAITPLTNRGGDGFQVRSRAAISASLTSTCSVRPRRSNVITSPSRTAAIGPPVAASGATWPAINPRGPPQKRPAGKAPPEAARAA